MKDLSVVQQYMKDNRIDLWLLYDFRGTNDVMWQLLGPRAFTTRRVFLAIPQAGEPMALVHALDEPAVSRVAPANTIFYRSRFDIDEWLHQLVRPGMTVATEYSPDCAIPTLSIIDAGMMERLKDLGVSVVSSENLFQQVLAVWDESALESHLFAVKEVSATLRMAIDFVATRLGNGDEISEYDVQQFIVQQFIERGLEIDEAPIVAVNGNSGRPHYMPEEDATSQVTEGDWLLIDLWARRPGNDNVFADITWVTTVGSSPSPEQQAVFEAVAGARDAVVQRLRDAWDSQSTMAGWELDDVARRFISERGYEDAFIHRTGHSIGPGRQLHAMGVNLDNFETHDTRFVLPGVGFSVEPGVYLSDFGVRSEIDVYVDPEKGPTVTTPLQDAIEVIGLRRA